VERDRNEWRRPWRDEDTPEQAAPAFTGPDPQDTTAPGVAAGTPASGGAAAADDRTEGSWAAPTAGAGGDRVPGEGTEPIASYPQPPPAGWSEGHQGPGSPAGSVRPPDTTGTVDAPERERARRGLGLGAVVVAALVGALVATGVTLGAVELTDRGPADAPNAAPPSIEVDGESSEVIPAVARAVTPSVVSITVEGAGGGMDELPFGDMPQREGLGSGVIYHEDGYILTNHHVIEGAETVRVRLANGEVFDAEVVGSDPLNDLAVVQVEEAGLPPVEIRPDDEPLVVGETVVAIGSPFGLDGSVTSGIISALNRDLTIPDEQEGVGLTIPSIVQTDAAINPGNSGGALVDAQGRLVGINTAILTGTGANQGVGFAVPADQAISAADQLIQDGFVRHPLLGITGFDITPDLAEEFGLDANQGAVVEDVQPDTGAAEAGVEPGDIIVEVDGEPLATMSELVAIVREHDPGDDLQLSIVREGEPVELTVTLGERPR
jgi:S1-C subfamily serine protease